MNKYCFVANYFLTPLQSAVASRLIKRGFDIYWIVVNASLKNMLVNNGWCQDNILYVHLDISNEDGDFVKLPIKFHDFLHGDRALRHNPKKGLRYLHAAAHKIYDFINKHRPDFVFGENTWAHERIAAAVCASSVCGSRYLAPHTVRFPSDRWGFFDGEDQEILVGNSEAVAGIGANTAMSASTVVAKIPSYVQRNNELLANSRKLSARINRVKRFITRENIDKSDPTHIQSRIDTLIVMGREELNRVLYRFVKRRPVDEGMLNGKFILYAMHKQPESSIDVLGRYYDDQLSIICAIWRSLPVGWVMYVKEHTNAIGDRPPSFYSRINKLPNAYMIDEKASAAQLIKHAQAVFTVSGTIAYEAALMGRPAFTFANMFFNNLKNCCRIGIDDLKNCSDVSELVSKMILDNEKKNQFDVYKKSFNGKFTDVYTDPSVLSEDNLNKLEYAFISLSKK